MFDFLGLYYYELFIFFAVISTILFVAVIVFYISRNKAIKKSIKDNEPITFNPDGTVSIRITLSNIDYNDLLADCKRLKVPVPKRIVELLKMHSKIANRY